MHENGSGTEMDQGMKGSQGSWAKAYDEKYQREYFYNHHLGVSQWERPEGYHEAADVRQVGPLSSPLCVSSAVSRRAVISQVGCRDLFKLLEKLSRRRTRMRRSGKEESLVWLCTWCQLCGSLTLTTKLMKMN